MNDFKAHPADIKMIEGTYLLAATVCASMSPGVRVDVKNLVKA